MNELEKHIQILSNHRSRLLEPYSRYDDMPTDIQELSGALYQAIQALKVINKCSHELYMLIKEE